VNGERIRDNAKPQTQPLTRLLHLRDFFEPDASFFSGKRGGVGLWSERHGATGYWH
jgi:hypothetical protein